MIELNKIKSPFIYYCQKVIPLAFDESLSYYEQLCNLTAKIKEVIENQNIETSAIEELQNKYLMLVDYVDHYFENMDVQEEINNKLDQMALDGTLEEIIGAYLSTNAIIGFNNINDLKASENVIEGSIVKIIGYNAINDGGINTYKVRAKQLLDIPDNINLIQLNDNKLVAELIKENDFIPIEKEGYYEFTGAQGNHAKVWYAIINKNHKPKLTLANDTIDTRQYGYENAKDNLSTVTINAGIFDTDTDETIGIIIKDGITIRGNIDAPAGTEILIMLQDGTLESLPRTTDTAIIESLNPDWALNGFYAIVKDGVDLTPARDPNSFSERSFIGQDSEGNYIVGVCNGRDYYYAGMSMADIVAFCNSVNFTPYFLYNLDGGGSSELDIRGERVNDLEYFTDIRKVANFLTFKSNYARNKSIFEKSVTNTEKWINDQINENVGINILPMLSPADENISIVAGSSAIKKGKTTILNLIIRASQTIPTYTNLIQGIPRLAQGRDVQFCQLIKHNEGTAYLCYLYDTEHTVRLPGAAALPNGLPAGDYALNIVYNNYI